MSKKVPDPFFGKDAPETEDQRIEREIRRGRKFTLSEAVGREGAPMLKGASPVPAQEQALLKIGEFLDAHLHDADGAMRQMLLRRLEGQGALLAQCADEPLRALESVIRPLAEHDGALRDFVVQTDAEWGRMYDEHPRFERPGAKPDSDDPYTVDSVKEGLSALLEDIARGG